MFGFAKGFLSAPQRSSFVVDEDPSVYMDTDLDTEEMILDVMGGGPDQIQTKLVHTEFFNDFEDDFDDEDLN